MEHKLVKLCEMTAKTGILVRALEAPPPAAAASWRGTRRGRECDGHATLRGARRLGAVGDERAADVLVAEAGREGVCRMSGGGG